MTVANTRITTDRLLLRELRKEDWQAVHEYGSDPEVVRFVEFGPNTEEETRDFIRRATASAEDEPRKGHDFAVVRGKDGRLIGGCGIYVTKPEHREAFIGYVFNREYWGNGYATEAAQALLRYGFETLRMHRIFATCDPENRASARVLEKTGMRREGLLRENSRMKGKYRDDLIYAILDREWRSASERGARARDRSITIRQAVREDVVNLLGLFAEVDTLHRKALPAMFQDPPGNVRGADFFDALFADENAALFVAESSGKMIGFVLVRIRQRPGIPIIVPGAYGVIEDIVVAPEARRSGLGRELIKKAEGWAAGRGVGLVELTVWEFNRGAIRFYESLGYENASRKMWKDLARS
jgi:RimJ/RimL family protein N-acetyltransferase